MCIFFERLVNSNFDLNFLATEATLQAKRLEIKDVLLEKRSNFNNFNYLNILCFKFKTFF
jgi:hypothetical protein